MVRRINMPATGRAATVEIIRAADKNLLLHRRCSLNVTVSSVIRDTALVWSW